MDFAFRTNHNVFQKQKPHRQVLFSIIHDVIQDLAKIHVLDLDQL